MNTATILRLSNTRNAQKSQTHSPATIHETNAIVEQASSQSRRRLETTISNKTPLRNSREPQHHLLLVKATTAQTYERKEWLNGRESNTTTTYSEPRPKTKNKGQAIALPAHHNGNTNATTIHT